MTRMEIHPAAQRELEEAFDYYLTIDPSWLIPLTSTTRRTASKSTKTRCSTICATMMCVG